MLIGVPKEIRDNERRVALVPQSVRELKKLGFDVQVESGAGETAEYSDATYEAVGATIVDNAETVWSTSDLLIKVREPKHAELEMLKDGATLISFFWPAQSEDDLNICNAKNVTAIAVDCIPRITRAQKMDVLSAMSNIAGYRAVIEAANEYPHFFTGQITAAGKIDPAKVLIIGGGVAGLASLGTAKGLGAIVRAFDTRLAVREQVESLGGEFLQLDFPTEDGEGSGGYAKTMSEEFLKAELKLFAEQALEVDIIITTALIPGRPAPELITSGMVESMKEGSVIVDLAAERGGNCTLTVPHEKVVHHGVTILGYTDFPSRMAALSSRLYGTAVVHLIEELGGCESFAIDMDNEIIRGCTVTHEGATTWPPPKPQNPGPKYSVDTGERPVDETKQVPEATEEDKRSALSIFKPILLALTALAIVFVSSNVPESFLSHLTVFVLACFVGWQVIWNVTPALHTPLMSVTNAISGIIIIGGILLISNEMNATTVLGMAAVFFAAINIAGGFLVTKRMLGMFRK
ncbi:MAG: Re/Si-specific NAD(P)(+) transhydrogenase subunit alpha [Phycisphaerales bacterium]|nr:Re/Si-specific NAD(P)(+) transhydrogenase subunit alpha [Phycisphaerales bacterium]